MAQHKRGARTANRPKGKPPRKRWQIWLRRLLVWGGTVVAVLLLALGTSVYFAARSMPG
jgi:penicillin-binding protein 1A